MISHDTLLPGLCRGHLGALRLHSSSKCPMVPTWATVTSQITTTTMAQAALMVLASSSLLLATLAMGWASSAHLQNGMHVEKVANVALSIRQAMCARDTVHIRHDMLSVCMQAPYGGQGATSGFGGGYGQGQSSKYQGGAYNQGGAYPAPQRGGRGRHAWCSLLLSCPADLLAARPDVPVCS